MGWANDFMSVAVGAVLGSHEMSNDSVTPAPTPPKVYRVEPREFRDLVQRLTGAPAAAMARQHQHTHQLQRAPTQPVPVRPGGVEDAAAGGQMYAPWCSFPLMGPPASMHPGLDGHHLM